MNWPEYSDSQTFNEDSVMLSVKESMLILLKEENPLVVELNNIQQRRYLSSNWKSFSKAFSLYFNPCKVFSSELHSLFFKKNRVLYINASKPNFSNRKGKERVSSISFKRGDICTFLYDPTVSNLKGVENCHLLAKYIESSLPSFDGVTSYCQKAFFECKGDENSFDENTTLSYGHNTLKEREYLPVSSIFLYRDDQTIRIFIYMEKLVLITVNKNLRLPYKSSILNGEQVSQILNSLIFNYLHEQ